MLSWFLALTLVVNPLCWLHTAGANSGAITLNDHVKVTAEFISQAATVGDFISMLGKQMNVEEVEGLKAVFTSNGIDLNTAIPKFQVKKNALVDKKGSVEFLSMEKIKVRGQVFNAKKNGRKVDQIAKDYFARLKEKTSARSIFIETANAQYVPPGPLFFATAAALEITIGVLALLFTVEAAVITALVAALLAAGYGIYSIFAIIRRGSVVCVDGKYHVRVEGQYIGNRNLLLSDDVAQKAFGRPNTCSGGNREEQRQIEAAYRGQVDRIERSASRGNLPAGRSSATGGSK